jgi:cation diffusion facilitator CzcD-associated flavoprotein CzcO
VRTGQEAQATVVVVGAGQAGLSAAFHLQRRGFVDARTTPGPRTYVVFDANSAPGGAWQHRWESLRMATVNGIFDLPGFPQPAVDGTEPSREAVPHYFAAFEQEHRFPILRPVTVDLIEPVDDDPEGWLRVQTSAGVWLAQYVVNATGTWTNPVLPTFPGSESFLGRQLHTRDYVDLEQFRGLRVAVVGGGISALQQLEEISRVAHTFWYTRREPVFLDREFDHETIGRDVVARVAADVEAGRRTGSVVSYTGLAWTAYARAAAERGVLERRPLFVAIEPHGLREADGSFTSVDAIVWATGFRPALDHLAPLDLISPLGGIAADGTRARNDHRVHLIGFGPSQSTVGANRAGRDAVAAIVADLRTRPHTMHDTPDTPGAEPSSGVTLSVVPRNLAGDEKNSKTQHVVE